MAQYKKRRATWRYPIPLIGNWTRHPLATLIEAHAKKAPLLGNCQSVQPTTGRLIRLSSATGGSGNARKSQSSVATTSSAPSLSDIFIAFIFDIFMCNQMQNREGGGKTRKYKHNNILYSKLCTRTPPHSPPSFTDLICIPAMSLRWETVRSWQALQIVGQFDRFAICVKKTRKKRKCK